MSAQPQQNIRAFLNSTARRSFMQAKQMLREEGEKKVQELKAKIPTPQEIQEKLLSELCDPRIIAKINATHAQLMGIVLPIENTLLSVDGFLEKNKMKLHDVKNKVFKPIEDLIKESGTLFIAIGTLDVLLQVAKNAYDNLPAPPPGPDPTKKFGRKFLELMNKVESKVGIYIAVIAAFPITIARYKMQADSFINMISVAQAKIQQFLSKVTNIRLFLDFLKLQMFIQCNVDDTNINEAGDSEVVTITADDILGADDETWGDVSNNMSQALQNYHEVLELEGKREVAEQLYALKFDVISKDYVIDHRISYKVKIIPVELSD